MISTIRAWTMQDLDNLVKYGNNPKIAKFMSDQFPNPYTIEKAKAFIENAIKDSPLRIFAIDLEGQAVGGIGIHPNAELGYWLAEPYWGKGIITNAIKQIVAHGFKYFDIDRIFARPFGTNIASHKVLEKAGFTLEARFEKTIIKNGEYLDELIYAIKRVQ